jgi:type II secretory pathway pseudopilin PulG
MKTSRLRRGESGYVLLALMLTLTLILIAMSVEAPRIVQQIKREKEEELVHRGKDYATAVKRFVHKNGGQYPSSVEQLENTNHIRFLRKKYKDPMTGESDWKMVHVGEAEVKIPAPNPGLSGGGLTPSGGGVGGTGPGGTGTGGAGTGGTGTGGTGTGGTGTGGTGAGGTGGTGLANTLTSTNIGNGQTVGGGQIMGVASTKKAQGIKEFNDKDHYDEWYFVYDLRLEQSGGTGVTVAAPRGAGTATGATGASGATGAQNPSGPVNPSGTVNPPGTEGQPTVPTGTPAATPPPTGTPATPPQVPN